MGRGEVMRRSYGSHEEVVGSSWGLSRSHLSNVKYLPTRGAVHGVFFLKSVLIIVHSLYKWKLQYTVLLDKLLSAVPF